MIDTKRTNPKEVKWGSDGMVTGAFMPVLSCGTEPGRKGASSDPHLTGPSSAQALHPVGSMRDCRALDDACTRHTWALGKRF